jgi:hypothetical protein
MEPSKTVAATGAKRRRLFYGELSGRLAVKAIGVGSEEHGQETSTAYRQSVIDVINLQHTGHGVCDQIERSNLAENECPYLVFFTTAARIHLPELHCCVSERSATLGVFEDATWERTTTITPLLSRSTCGTAHNGTCGTAHNGICGRYTGGDQADQLDTTVASVYAGLPAL